MAGRGGGGWEWEEEGTLAGGTELYGDAIH